MADSIQPSLTQVFAATKALAPYVTEGDYPGDTPVDLSIDGTDLLANLAGIGYRIQSDGQLVDAAGRTGGQR